MEDEERRDVVVLTRLGRRRIAWSLAVGFLVGAAVGAGCWEKRRRGVLNSIRSHHAEVQTVDAASGEPLPIILYYLKQEDSYGFPRSERTTAHSMSEFKIEWIGKEPTYRVRVCSDGYEPREVTLDDSSSGAQVVKLDRAKGRVERER